MQNNAIDHHKVQRGLDFILNHFQGPLFPRKVMTEYRGINRTPISFLMVDLDLKKTFLIREIQTKKEKQY
jgi:hypothetical protein